MKRALPERKVLLVPVLLFLLGTLIPSTLFAGDSISSGTVIDPPLESVSSFPDALGVAPRLPSESASDALGDAPAVGPESGLSLAEVVETTLANNPDILIQKSDIRGKEGAVTQAKGSFAPVLNSAITRDHQYQALTRSDSRSLGKSYVPIANTQYQIAYQRKLRSGTVISPNITFTREEYEIPRANPESRGEISFEIKHPLRRGNGHDSSLSTNEDAARLSLEAGHETLRTTVNRTLFQTLDAFWNYLGSARRLEVLLAAEERAARLAEETETLIKADQRPLSERSQVTANRASKQADRIGAETSLRQNRRALGVLLGLSAEEVGRMPLPLAEFPNPASASLPASFPERLLEQTLQCRPDLLDLRNQRRAAARLTAGSRNDEKPQVDFTMSLGLAGLDENKEFGTFVTPFSKNVKGFHVVVGVQSELPLRNDRATGVRIQREVQEKKLAIQYGKAELDVKTGLDLAWSSVIDSIRQAECSSIAVTTYRQAVENEKEKLANGMSTILDLITMEDRLTNALLSDIQAQVNLARAIASLRYETGTISRKEGGRFVVDTEAFSSTPTISSLLEEEPR